MTKKRKSQPPSHPLWPVMQVMPMAGQGDIPSDVAGSYTGTPADGTIPEQDADDL